MNCNITHVVSLIGGQNAFNYVSFVVAILTLVVNVNNNINNNNNNLNQVFFILQNDVDIILQFPIQH